MTQLNRDELKYLFAYAKPLSTEVINQFANNWSKLVTENGELRVCVEGAIVSKKYEDYDEIILLLLSQIELEEGKYIKHKLVGSLVLEQIISNMSDSIGYFLVNRFLQNNKIMVVNFATKESFDEIVVNG